MLRDEADLAARLEHRPAHLVERVDLARRACSSSSWRVSRSRCTLRASTRPSSIRTIGSPSSTVRTRLKRKLRYETVAWISAIVPAARQQPRDRVVALRHALLDEVAEHDQHDQVERLQRGELTAVRRSRVRKKMKAKAKAARRTMSMIRARSVRCAGERGDGLLAVVELDLQRPRADRGRVDLVVHVEDVLRARRQVAELEGELAVAAGLVDRARLDRVHGQAVDPASRSARASRSAAPGAPRS